MSNWLADPLVNLYLFCFAFGLIFSVVSLFARLHVGRLHLPLGHHGGHGTHIQIAGHHGGHGHTATPHGHSPSHSATGAPSPLNLNSITVFLLWFGATGYILHTYYGALAGLSLAAATLVGWIGAALIYLFMAKVLWRGQTELDPENYHPAGAIGRVTSAIHAGGTGEVIYTLDGKRRVDGARSVDGTPLANGTAVAIVRRQDGIAYVCPLATSDEHESPL